MSGNKKSLLALGALAAARAAVAQSVTVPPVTNGTTTAVVPQSSVWTYWNTTVSTVTVVDELTTVCVEKTTLTFNDCEYPVTEGETLVVTNCPCTLTTAVPTITSSLCPPGVLPPPTEAPWYPPTETGAPPGVVPPPGEEESHVPPPPPGAASKSGAAPAPTSTGAVPVNGAGRTAAVGGLLGAVAAAALGAAVAL
ncbi:hypothetical protein SLS62_002489 [Diatrype stigma]|uniref:Uncharacterized protein n=1 Tax=Diatrype stigma TaxID=117547 RepID=A0AAN9YVP1_9PEZI